VVTMSANATASTNVTVNGTLQNSNLAQIIVTSATGLATSMTVTGTGMQTGTIITGLSGTTITLNQVADVTALMSATTTFSATPKPRESSILVAAISVTVSVGQIVVGPGISSTATAKVTSVTSDVSAQTKDITLDYSIGTHSEGSYSFYTLGSQSAVSYTFEGPDTYKISKLADGILPFGSFPTAGRTQ